MLLVDVTIAGLTPLLMSRFHENAQMEASSGVHSRKEALSPYEDAQQRLYTTEETGPYLPAENLRQGIIAAASRHKIGRKAAGGDMAAALFVTPFAMPVVGGWKVDSRPVVIPATRGRIIRHRPIFEEWRCSFVLGIDVDLVDVQLVRRILDDAGNYVGVGDFRPQKKGPYGRFSVVNWSPQGE